jgi:hypothetical protein
VTTASRPHRGEAVWARHYQHVWQERSADKRLPDWLRIAAVAYGNHAANGHARLGRGDLRLILTRIEDDGTRHVPQAANVRRALDVAVRNGWLAPGSTTMCLIVPAHAVTGGIGNPDAVCDRDEKHAEAHARRRKPTPRPTPLRVVGKDGDA